ncbi:MAG: fibronectin type III domain-containing protein [Lachnospiraceae bacterium]|nr:fibronectin type III domain-containing protein [Lachnospiraceae bacterium]
MKNYLLKAVLLVLTFAFVFMSGVDCDAKGDTLKEMLSAEGENETQNQLPCSGVIANPTNIKLVDCNADSATVSWDAVPGATGYIFYYVFNGKAGAMPVGNKTKYKFAVANLQNGGYLNECYIIAYAEAVDPTTGQVVYDYSCTGVGTDLGAHFTGIRRLTKKIKTIRVLNPMPSSKQFTIGAIYDGDGFEIEGMGMDGKNKFKGKGKNALTKQIKVKKKNTVYKFRVRPYVKLAKKTKKGKWSAWQYFICIENDAVQGNLVNRTSNKKYKLSWPKLNGVSKIVLSRSTSTTGSFTKVGTAKGSSTSFVINKTFELYTTYYVKLTFYSKVGKKEKKVDEKMVSIRIVRQ